MQQFTSVKKTQDNDSQAERGVQLILRRLSLSIAAMALALLVVDQLMWQSLLRSLTILVVIGGLMAVPFQRRFGRTPAAWWLVSIIWIAVTWLSWQHGGLRFGVIGSYLLVIMLGVLLLPRQQWVIALAFSLTASFMTIIADVLQMLPISILNSENIFEVVLPQASILLTGSLLVLLVSRRIETVLTLIVGKTTALREGHELLEQRSAELSKTNARLQLEISDKETNFSRLKKAESDLRISERRYRLMFEHDPRAIILTDISTQQIIDCNESSLRLFGYEREELTRRSLYELMPRIQPEWVGPDADLLALDQATNGEEAVYEWSFHNVYGERFPAEVRLVRLPGEDESPLLQYAIEDISARHYAIRALRDSEGRYRALVENAPEALLVLDVDNHCFVEVNAKAAELLGWTRIELLSRSVEDLLQFGEQESGEPHTLDSIVALTQSKDSLLIQSPQSCADGTHFASEIYITVLPTGNRTLLRLSLFNITERKAVEVSLQREREQLKQFVSSIPGSVAITTADEDGIILWANEEMARKINTTLDEVIGQPVSRFYANSDRRSPLLDLVREHGSVRGYEFEAIDAHGQKYWARASATLLEYDGQLCTLGIVEDIDELKRRQLAHRQMQKLESLGVLAGGIAHDFNNLLVAILGQTSLALAKLDDNHRANRHIEKAVSAARRASQLTQQMLAYSGRGQFEVRECNINTLIKDNQQLFELSVPEHVTFESNMMLELPGVSADPTQIQQLLLNLIQNAAEAIDLPHGEVRVETSLLVLSAETLGRFTKHTGNSLLPGPYIAINIADTGRGLQVESIGQIFDPFFSTKERGSGLGLAAVLGIIRGHKGGLRVTSRSDSGTTFQVVLPTVEVLERMRLMEATAEDSHKAVLVIDDEAAVRNAVADILSSDGLNVLTATSGEDGIARYTAQAPDIGLVLLDYSMPGMDGTETLQHLRRVDPTVRVVLSSGLNLKDAEKAFGEQGLLGYIEKPYDANSLRTQIRSLIG